jgi:hypothetical protein
MPFFLIPTTLGVCFFLVWLFIGGMILRDGQLAAQQEREFDGTILPLSMHRVGGPSFARRGRTKRMRGKPARVAT